MRQRFSPFVLAAALAVAASISTPPSRADETTTVFGAITYISADAVEVAGQRGLLVNGADIRSDERTVSWTSIRVGMPASMETDSAGRVLELRVSGVIE